MKKMDWLRALDLPLAARNVSYEFKGDWYKDPWGWPELDYIVNHAPETIAENCSSTGARAISILDVPKENWGTRPAVVLNIVDRLTYQAIVDNLSYGFRHRLPSSVFGWRLPVKSPVRGMYASNKSQWAAYRGRLQRLASTHDVALKTDITSFFASISFETIEAYIEDNAPKGLLAERLLSFLQASQRPERSGLPQRSQASAVLANMILTPLDDVLTKFAVEDPEESCWAEFGPGFTRWMDDIWLFVRDPADARAAQRELHNACQSIGLHLNSAKTDLLEGTAVAEQALLIEHSAIDDALLLGVDFDKLEELVDRIILDPNHVSRTTVKFAVSRLVMHNRSYRTNDLLEVACRMPHVADSLSRLFKSRLPSGLLEDWFLDYTAGGWSSVPWAVAQYSRLFPSGTRPRRAVREFFMNKLSDVNTELPLLAVSGQRMSNWDPVECRPLITDAIRRTDNPHARRVLALAGLKAGVSRNSIGGWLQVHSDNQVTIEMLKSRGFVPLKERPTYAQ